MSVQIRDPLLRQITTALDQPLDGNQFEAAMCSLLVDLYPMSVPVAGGNDAGMEEHRRISQMSASRPKLGDGVDAGGRMIHDGGGIILPDDATALPLQQRRHFPGGMNKILGNLGQFGN